MKETFSKISFGLGFIFLTVRLRLFNCKPAAFSSAASSSHLMTLPFLVSATQV